MSLRFFGSPLVAIPTLLVIIAALYFTQVRAPQTLFMDMNPHHTHQGSIAYDGVGDYSKLVSTSNGRDRKGIVCDRSLNGNRAVGVFVDNGAIAIVTDQDGRGGNCYYNYFGRNMDAHRTCAYAEDPLVGPGRSCGSTSRH